MTSSVRGNYDGVHQDCLAGWVLHPAKYPVDVIAMIDGDVVGIALAQEHRGDVAAAGIGDGRSGFRIPIPERFLDGRRHRADLWINGGEDRLCPAFHVQSDVNPQREPAATQDDPLPATASVIVPSLHGVPPRFTRTIRSNDEIALYNTALAQLDMLSAQSPLTPYYGRLKLATRGTERLDCIARIVETLRQIDLARLGQSPKADHLVSIVMPAHNRRHLIGDAIRSVLSQSYGNWQLVICDDASDDDTLAVIEAFGDPRIEIVRHGTRRGAAVARNSCLAQARGEVVAYLDSDNIWHPRYLELMVEELEQWPGHQAAYAGYFDLDMDKQSICIRKGETRPFDLEDQIAVPYVDLNSLVHRRALHTVLGGFDERLNRRQDYDLIARYCWAREPRAVPHVLNLYQRIAHTDQITRVQGGDNSAPAIIADKIAGYYRNGVPVQMPDWIRKVSVVSWDMSRNHFAKAFSVAEALSKRFEVELISYRFFEDPIFPPLADTVPPFECKYFEGADFPDFFAAFDQSINAISGDVIYAVKPRLTSFGLALLANSRTGKPVMVESNDLETVVAQASASDRHARKGLDDLLRAGEAAHSPYDLIWSEILDPLVADMPVAFTHNINLNLHYDRRCLYMRNVKDADIFSPDAFDRTTTRAELGLSPRDRVILFGGLVRRHKGVFELVTMLNRLNDPRYKLVIVGSRETPDLAALRAAHGDQVRILPPQDAERMAAINAAADIVVLWQDPTVPAGQYQSPYKMSDAFAMGPTVIASPTSDLAAFAQRDLMLSVPYGDHDGLMRAIRSVFDRPEQTARRRMRTRRLFEREFSYPAVLSAFALGAASLEQHSIYPAATRFADAFERFRNSGITDRR